ncbi:MAG: hypothetical protein ACRYGC_06500 [Janthinobacterium lividum]
MPRIPRPALRSPFLPGVAPLPAVLALGTCGLHGTLLRFGGLIAAIPSA